MKTEETLEKIRQDLAGVEIVDDAEGCAWKVARQLRRKGWKVKREVAVTDRGDSARAGRIDLLAILCDTKVAIEIDRVKPRAKSILKLRQIDGVRVLLLRSGKSPVTLPEGIDAVINLRMADSLTPRGKRS